VIYQVFFYRGYIKLRSVDIAYAFLDPTERVIEEYIGGYARFNWREKFNIIADGEFLAGGEYQFNGRVASNILNLKYSSKKYNVPYIYLRYFGNHGEWNNNFEPIFSNSISGDFTIKKGKLELKPKGSFISYGNFTYFNEDIQPTQASGTTLLSTIGTDFNVRLAPSDTVDGFRLENELLISSASGASAQDVRLPPLHYNGRFFFRGKWFDNMVPVETGFGLTARTSYFANAYDPVTKQFYVQNDQDIFGYWRADFFLNMKLTNFYFSFKWNYINQPSDSGYFTTPFHPASSRSIDLIVRWLFFD